MNRILRKNRKSKISSRVTDGIFIGFLFLVLYELSEVLENLDFSSRFPFNSI